MGIEVVDTRYYDKLPILYTGEARICVSNFSYLLGPKNRPFEWQAEAKAIQTTTSWTPELAQVHVTARHPPCPPKTKI